MSSRHFSTPLVVTWLLTLVLAASAGWWAGTRSKAVASRADVSSSPPAPAPPRIGRNATPPTGRPSEAVASASADSAAPADRARAALSLTNPARRKRAFFAFLESMTAAEAPAVERVIFDLNRQGLDFPDEWYAFLARWGEVDPAAAMALVQSKRDAGEPEGVLRGFESTIFAAWAAEDAGGARLWLERQPDGEETASLWGALILGIAQQDLAAATTIAVEKTTPGTRPQKAAMEQLSEIAVRQGGVAGMQAWFDGLPEASKRDASSHVHWRNMQASIETGADWLAAQSTTPWRKDSQIRELADRWIGQDPAAATHWTASLPPGQDAADPYPGLRSSIGAWTTRAPEEVAAWLASQSTQPFYDSAAAGVALHYLGRGGDAATGEKWLGTVRSAEIREAVTQSLRNSQ